MLAEIKMYLEFLRIKDAAFPATLRVASTHGA